MIQHLPCSIFFVFLLSTAIATAAQYRVATVHGTPAIQKDGVTVSPHMFYGYTSATRSGSIAVGDAWSMAQLRFTAPESDGSVNVHLNLGDEPGSVLLDDLSLVDETSPSSLIQDDFEASFPALLRDWKPDPATPVTWRPAAGKTGKALEVKIDGDNGKTDKRVKGYHMLLGPLTLVKNHDYSFQFQVRATGGERRLRIEFKHQGGDWRTHAALKPPMAEQVKLAAAHGVHFISFSCPVAWPEAGQTPSLEKTFQACREVLAANPRAQLLPRLSMEPPDSWRKSHPNDLVEFEDGKKSSHGSVASANVRRDAISALRLTLRALEAKFGSNLAGYHLTGQNTGEWFYPQAWGWRMVGFEAPMREAWARLDEGPFPTAQERRDEGIQALLDPVRQSKRVAFNRFLQDTMADHLLALSRVVREEAPGRLTLLFYAYTFQMATYRNGAACTGHLATRRLLDSPDVDILCGPIAYNDRQVGGSAPCMAAGESITKAGKLWLNEDDTSGILARAAFFDYPGWGSGPSNWTDTLSLARRNLAQNRVRHFPTWWMDLGATGWWNDERIWAPHDELAPVLKADLTQAKPFRPDIALVVDEAAGLFLANNDAALAVSRKLVYDSRTNLSRVGAPYGQWLLDDEIAGNIQARLHILANAWAVADGVRAKLAKDLSVKNVIWAWAAGALTSKGFDANAMHVLTGFKFERLPEESIAMATPTEEGRAIGLIDPFGVPTNIAPLLSPGVRPGDGVWARYDNGKPAVVLHVRPDGSRVLFCGVPELPTPLLREMARLSGVHLYTREPSHVWARDGFVSVHTTAAGTLNLDSGRKGKWRNLITGEQGTGSTLTRTVGSGETLLFFWE